MGWRPAGTIASGDYDPDRDPQDDSSTMFWRPITVPIFLTAPRGGAALSSLANRVLHNPCAVRLNILGARSLAHLMLAAAIALLFTAQDVKTIQVDGVAREALVFASKSDKPSPLVLAFHGYGGNMRNSARNMNVHERWPEATVVYLQGLPMVNPRDPANQRPGWDVMKPPPDNRDVKFVDALIADLKKSHKIDEKQVFAMGHSNGGRFSYLLWAERGDTFRAFSMCGSNSMGFEQMLKSKSAFLIAGVGDSTVPFANQQKSASFLKGLLKVDAALESAPGSYKVYKGAGGVELATYFHSGGHEYPADAGKMVAQFFRGLGSGK